MATAYVITPTGTVLRYSGVGHVVRGEQATELYTSKEKTCWVADVPNGWACGWDRPAGISVTDAAQELRRDIRNAPGSDLAAIKTALRSFDGRSQSWKD
jgi:hypothetical protein